MMAGLQSLLGHPQNESSKWGLRGSVGRTPKAPPLCCAAGATENDVPAGRGHAGSWHQRP